jgi:hypothetical protein
LVDPRIAIGNLRVVSDLPRLRHIPELVPSPVWGLSGSRLLPQPVWRRIRQAEVDRAGSRCEVCDRPQPKGLVCHEVWDYRVADRRGTATLTRLRMQCRACDQVTHYGLAESRGRGPAAQAWLARINGIDGALAAAIVEVAYERHASLSAVPTWDVRVHPDLAARHPDLMRIQQTAQRG